MKLQFGCRTKAFSCYVTLAEKPVARKSGLGFYGKNGVIITGQHGSCVVLGEILTDLALDPDEPLDTDCGTCRICMDACPTGAIPEPHRLDRNRCIQFLSGRRRTVPLDIRQLWQDRLYGCSTCQDVCPHNQDRLPVHREVPYGRVGASLAIEDAITMDDAGFAARFEDNQIGTREPAILRRNALLAAAHSGAGELLGPVIDLTRDADPMIRRHALWAAWKMQGPASHPLLRSALETEEDADIIAELKTLLDGQGGVR
jgi:epoxyqueuosine reductase